MLTWLTEDSFVPMITGALLALAFIGLAITQYSRSMFLIAIGIGLLTAGIVGVETYIVTNKEAVESTVRRLAKAVEKREIDLIRDTISNKRQDVKNRAEQEMALYSIDSCRLLDFTDFKLDDKAEPPTAETTFVVIARGGDQYGNRGTAHERVTLKFEKEPSGVWKIIDYSHVYARSGGRL